MNIEILKAVVWPLTVATIALVALFFHPGVKAAIPRIRKFGKWLEFDGDAIATQQIESDPAPHPVAAMLEELTAESKQWVTARKATEETRKLFNEAGKPLQGPGGEALLSLTGLLVALREFEETHNFIFGSQLWLLRKINGNRPGWTKAQVAQHLETVKQKFPGSFEDTSPEKYVTFLVARGLISVSGEMFTATDKGADFLSWMAQKGRSDDKPF